MGVMPLPPAIMPAAGRCAGSVSGQQTSGMAWASRSCRQQTSGMVSDQQLRCRQQHGNGLVWPAAAALQAAEQQHGLASSCTAGRSTAAQ